MRYLLLISILWVSCTTNETELKTEVPRSVFKEALKGALVIEARANKERVQLGNDTIPIDAYYAVLYSKLGITGKQFKETFDVYNDHPKAFQDLFDDIAAELEVESDSLDRALKK